MNNELDEEVISTTPEETTDSNYVETDASSEDIEDIKSRLAKAEELAFNYKVRAEKAEKRVERPESSKVAPTKTAEFSPLDIIAISKANIDTDDVEDVVDYARYKGISISEALKSNVIKTTLSQKEEMRKTAQATSTGQTRRGSSQISDERLLADASKGLLPDSDSDIERLASLQVNRKR